jgi:hypothetical protein
MRTAVEHAPRLAECQTEVTGAEPAQSRLASLTNKRLGYYIHTNANNLYALNDIDMVAETRPLKPNQSSEYLGARTWNQGWLQPTKVYRGHIRHKVHIYHRSHT